MQVRRHVRAHRHGDRRHDLQHRRVQERNGEQDGEHAAKRMARHGVANLIFRYYVAAATTHGMRTANPIRDNLEKLG